MTMRFECKCGNLLNDVGYPNDTEHFLLNTRSIERFQDLVDDEVSKEGQVEMWPEHWEQSGAVVIWKCHQCGRLYVNPGGRPQEVVVYSIERIGL